MEDIKKILKVLNTKKLRKTLEEEDSSGKNELLVKFYHGCISGTFHDDKEASEALYSTTPDDNRYQILKSRVKHRLFEDLLYCNFSSKTNLSYEAFVIESQKIVVSCRLLLGFGVKEVAIDELKKILKKAESYSATEVAIDCNRMLKDYYWFKGDTKEFDSYTLALRRSILQLNDEIRAEELHEQIAFPFTQQKTPSTRLKEISHIYKRELDGLRRRTSTYRVQIAYFRFNIIYSQIHERYYRVVNQCTNFENYLESIPIPVSESLLGECALSKAEAHLYVRQYKESQQWIEAALSLFPEKGSNWYNTQKLHFMILIHQEKIDEAGILLYEVINSRYFKTATEAYREEWLIYESYFRLLLRFLYRQNGNRVHDDSSYSFYKFLNEVPLYSHDKQGANISILILHVLWLLQEQNYSKLIEFQKSIENYSSRYLNGDDSQSRSSIFLSLLLVYLRCDFDFKKSEEKGSVLIQKLMDMSTNTLVDPMEVVQFERLWVLIK